jgi:hypothetical protein
MRAMLSEFEYFPQEQEIVGSLLMAYGELEFALVGCLDEVIGPDLNVTARMMFRIKGEYARIQVSDAIIRPAVKKVGLDGQWACAFGAMDHCRKIRNQYAHCHWHLEDARLFFVDFDVDVESVAEELNITYRHVDLALLQQQKIYFEYATAATYFLFSSIESDWGEFPATIS